MAIADRGPLAKRQSVFFVGLLTLILWAFGSLQPSQARPLNADDGEPVGLLLLGPEGATVAAAPQLQTDVVIEINGLLARARVTQRFLNPTGDWLEGIYVFPLPDDAAVDRLRMRVGPRVIEGEIQARAQAARSYATARAKGQVASLVRQQRPNIFTTAVANIPPGEVVEVAIEYQQRLAWRDSAFTLRFPMVVAPRYIPGRPLAKPDNPRAPRGWAQDTDEVVDATAITPPVALQAPAEFNALSLRVTLNAGLPVESVDSLYHPVQVDDRGANRYSVMLADGPIPADRDFVLRWTPVRASQPQTAVFHEQWGGRHYALMLLMPPTEVHDRPAVGRELILVIDTSGSMHGASMEQARAGVLQALAQLGPQDRFNVIQFNSDVESLFDRARPANATNLRQARRYVQQLDADGGTEMRPALLTALNQAEPGDLLRQVVFLTDGAVGNERALFELIQQRLGDSRLFTVGIGSAPNAYFMRRAARFGRGTFTFIGSIGEVEEKIGQLSDELSQPVLTDLSVRWDLPTGALPAEPAGQRLPDLYAGRPLVVAIAAGQLPRAAMVEGDIAGRSWSHRARLNGGGAARGVHALWAQRRIDALLDARVTGADAEHIRQGVVDLALAHHLVSPFTSLVAVDKTPVRPLEDPLRSTPMAVRLPAGWSATAVFGRLPATATPSRLFALLGWIALLSALGVWWGGRRCR